MADVDAQLEANGLPTSFESSSNAPEVSHAVAANIAATTSNAEASQIKQHSPNLDVLTTNKPVLPVDSPAPQASEPVTAGNEASLQDDAPTQAETEIKVNGHSSVPKEDEPLVTDTSFNDSGLPSSIPSATDATADTSPATAPPTTTLPDQAPISDLRTAPHADALSIEEVAKVEAEKHEQDNSVEMQDTVPSPEIQVELSAADKESSLPTPQSPPAAVRTEEAILSDKPDATQSVVVTKTEEEMPAEPTPTPAEPAPMVTTASVVPEPQDQEMVDAPAPASTASKVREREDDTVDEPAPKRMRTEEPVTEEPSPKQQEPSISAMPEPSSNAPASSADDAVTVSRLVHMKRVISNLKKSTASQAFRTPVDPVALKIPTYFDIVKRPMDLGTIDSRLKRNEYQSIQVFQDDFKQIVLNCVAFNGNEHQITQAARKMETSFNSQMKALPPVVVEAEPPKMDKKVVKPKIEPVRQPASRRQSETLKAASPKAPSPTTFAPNPNGMPLIRRDSTIDGRPKRAIVPPKRNSDFGGARPKKKKYELELRFSDEVLKIISSSKHWQANQYFTHPVDPVALNIPTYFQIIKKPMDLGTVRQKLDGGMYERARDFEEDVRMIFKNCFKFNPKGDYVYARGEELEKLFNQEWAKKQDWIAAREPDSEPASIGGDDDEDESEEEEAGAESDEDDQNDQLRQLQQQLDAIKNQMGQLSQKKKKPSPGASSKKSSKKKSKSEVPTSKFPGLHKDGKAKKPAKKAKPVKERYVTFAEKQYISNGIAMLPEQPMSEALKIIQNSVPALANSDQGEIELDIEEVPNAALLKLLAFVKQYAGPPPDEPKEDYAAPSVSKSKKKSKSMSRQEQEAHIAELKGTLHSYQEAGSPDAVQSIETGAEDSDDDSDQESEEE